MSNNKKEVLLKNWSLVVSNPYAAPEIQKIALHGNAYGHENFSDGCPVTTTSILDVADHGAYKIVETRNTLYKIFSEDVDALYEQEYPNAFERLKAALKEEQ